MTLTQLHGVGPKLADKMNALGICQVMDLLFHLPSRYEDRTRIHPIGGIKPGQRVLIEGRIEHSAIVRGRRSMLVVVLFDGTGRITLRFFHFRNYQKQQLSSGTQLRCFGEVRAGAGKLEMAHPEYQRISDKNINAPEETMTPVYPKTEGVHQTLLRNIAKQSLYLDSRGLVSRTNTRLSS